MNNVLSVRPVSSVLPFVVNCSCNPVEFCSLLAWNKSFETKLLSSFYASHRPSTNVPISFHSPCTCCFRDNQFIPIETQILFRETTFGAVRCTAPDTSNGTNPSSNFSSSSPRRLLSFCGLQEDRDARVNLRSFMNKGRTVLLMTAQPLSMHMLGTVRRTCYS